VRERIDSLDTLKGLAILFVVYIHSKPFFSTGTFTEPVNFVLANASRFAVPAFFLTSGFLLSRKVSESEEGGVSFVKRQLEKIGSYYIFASAAYLLLISFILYFNRYLQLEVVSNWLNLSLLGLHGLFELLYIGKAIAPFLWFFTALFYSIMIVYFFNRKFDVRYLVVASAVLHVVAILSNTFLVFEGLPVPTEDAIFFGLLFTSTGFWIGKEKIYDQRTGKAFLGLTSVFFVLHLAERAFISATVPAWEVYFWDSYYWGPYSFFTAPMAVSLFLYFLKRPELGKGSRLNFYGKYTLTGYLIHPVVIGTLVGLGNGVSSLTGISVNGTTAWEFVMFPAAFLLTMEAAVRYQSSLNSFIDRLKGSGKKLRQKYTGF
jgi:surface polysaccharide O-acyltransferase-like enzyme